MKKKSLCFLRQQNKGSAIVIVIVAMAFVGILSSTLMWMSLMNYRMKTTDRQVKESFYDAETVLDQMVVGLQNVASDAADQAYSFIMQNYVNFSEDKRNVEFQREYLKNVRSAIAKSSTETDKYDLRKLMLYVDTGMKVGVVTPSTETGSWIGARDNTKAIESEDAYKAQYGVMEAPNDADYIMLKGLHLEYTDKDGFLSMIDTDIMIKTPDAGFTQTGRLSNVFDYAIIAENGIVLDKDATEVTVKGNVYAGNNGITVNKGKLNFENAEYLISKDDIVVKDGGVLKVGKGEAEGDMTDIWVAGIRIDKGTPSGGNVSLYGHTFVKDDLTVNADKASVNLTGSYYAYGNGTDEAKNSSAIIVNGEGNALDLSGVTHLLLAGHAYISAGGGNTQETYDELKSKKVEISTGESVAIKGNQVAYMVPDECIGVLYGQSIYGKNPLSKKEYEDLINNYSMVEKYANNFKEVDVNRQVERLGSKSLASYGINGIENVKKVFIPSNGETMVYYYLQFPSQDDAERYFADYYAIQKEKLNRYANVYTKGGIKAPSNYVRVTVEGNYLETDSSAGTMELRRPVDSISEGNNLEMELMAYQNTFGSLTTALTSNFLAVTEEEKARASVFENIVNTEKLRGLTTASESYEYKLDDGDKYKSIVTNRAANYGYSNPGSGDYDIVLILASGDVTVNGNFRGVIISGGKVTLKNGCSVTSAKVAGRMSELVRSLQKKHNSTDDTRAIDFMRNANKYVIAGTAMAKDDKNRMKNIDFGDYVKFQNWTKN